MADAAPTDKRLQFIEDYVLRALKLKADRWQKCVSSEENKATLQEFLEKGECHALVVSLNPAGLLVPTLDLPGSIKNKAVLFVKKNPGPLSADSIRNSLTFGDLSYSPLDQLSVLVEEVVAPILSNPKNQQNWPQVLSQDVLRHVSSLKSNISVMVGQVRGKTLLPLPSGSEKVEDIEYESDKKQAAGLGVTEINRLPTQQELKCSLAARVYLNPEDLLKGENLLLTALDMMKLEKIEFGGNKGNVLSQTVADMYVEFQETYKVFSERTYDCLDMENKEFEKDVSDFQLSVQDMDRRLGTLFCLAFGDTSGLEHTFRVHGVR
ncbi:dynein beta chain, ciliary-like [Pyxicephalus adspersus]|uniref:dynein beta chain, ciliary-like n=1 Tax=Pyxicephalus adspersus TaxID=30357 RepID=UPI003B59A6DD